MPLNLNYYKRRSKKQHLNKVMCHGLTEIIMVIRDFRDYNLPKA